MEDLARWKFIERIVAVLEQGLAPGARVEHDVKLPVLGRPDREPRQCDVTIRTGLPPRETLTIVEVQARTGRPEISELAGWVDKMREVGAQHLICVSEVGFPQSMISDAALRYGPTVRLMTIQQLESPNFPHLAIAPILIHKAPTFTLKALGPEIALEPRATWTGTKVNQDTRYSLGDDPQSLSLYDLLGLILADEGSAPSTQSVEYEREFDLGRLDPPAWITISGIKHRIKRLDALVVVAINPVRIPLQAFSYSQESIDGHVAWVATAVGSVGGKEVDLKILYTPTPEGFEMQFLTDPMTRGISINTFDSSETRDRFLAGEDIGELL